MNQRATSALVGVIGGSGLYQMDAVQDAQEHVLDTPFGAPSDVIVTGKVSFYYAGPNSAPEEPTFVPAGPEAPEGHGWLLTIVGRRAENRTDLVVLDAQNVSAGPVATIRIPFRLHEGFHGTWVATEVDASR